MTRANLDLNELITQLDIDTATADPLDRVTEAQKRAQSLSDIGDQLVGHFVSIAREAGASWSQIGDAIGVSKQAAQQRDSLRLYQNFTERARQALVIAQDAAREHHGAHITAEHLLVGVLGIEKGLAAQAMQHLVASLPALREELITILPRDAQTPPQRLVYAEMGRRVIDETVKSALKLNHNYVGTEHLLLGVLAAGGPAAELLIKHGVTAELAEQRILADPDAIVAGMKEK
jgi:hypothetical protein